MFPLRIAWRNLWRNWKRTAICLSAASLTTAVLIVWFGLVMGLIDQMSANATDLGGGEVQVHAPGYRSEPSVYNAVSDPAKVMDAARRAGLGASARSIVPALLSVGVKSAGCLLYGVLPPDERLVGELPSHLEQGTFLGDVPAKQLVLGTKLARSLNVTLGSEVVLVGQATDGSTSNDLFRVVGILRPISESLDRGTAYVHREDLDAFSVLGGAVHQISLHSRGAQPLTELAQFAETAAAGNDVRTWRELAPALVELVDLFKGFTYVLISIFFAAAALGIVNALLMASFERIPEYGLILALGATPGRIIREVAIEGAILGVASSVLGGVVGGLGCWYLERYGLDISSFGQIKIAGFAASDLWRARLGTRIVALPITLMWLVSAAASLYPAVKAARLDPVAALAHQ